MAFYKKEAIILYIASSLKTPKRQSQLLFQPIWILQEILKNSSDVCFFQTEINEISWKKYRLFLKSLSNKMDEFQIFSNSHFLQKRLIFTCFNIFHKRVAEYSWDEKHCFINELALVYIASSFYNVLCVQQVYIIFVWFISMVID